MCISRRRPAILSLSRCAQCRILLKSVVYTYTRTYTRIHTHVRFFRKRAYRMRVRVRIEVQQPPEGRWRIRERRGRREVDREGREGGIETHGCSIVSTSPGRGSSFLGRPFALSVTGSTGILLERYVVIAERLEKSESRASSLEIAAPR